MKDLRDFASIRFWSLQTQHCSLELPVYPKKAFFEKKVGGLKNTGNYFTKGVKNIFSIDNSLTCG